MYLEKKNQQTWHFRHMTLTDSCFTGQCMAPQILTCKWASAPASLTWINLLQEYPDSNQSHLSLLFSSTCTSYSPSKKVFLSSVLHDSHCRRTFFPSSFSPVEEPRFLAADLEFPAGLLGGIPDVPPGAVPSLSAAAKNHDQSEY